ncbi:MAG: hypothetical protein KBS52_03635 [Clostridiales bacterium]|nr:hypothetical protein [Candidatus Equinaster intestinalis]
MKRVATINLRKAKFFEIFSENKFLMVITVIYFIGVLLGVIFLKKSSAVFSVAANSFSAFVKVRSGSDFFSVLLSAFTSFLPIVLILFLSGTSVVGVVLSPLTISYCGFAYGITAGYLYSNFTLKGIAFNSLILIPCTLIAVIGYFICSRAAFNLSLNLVRVTLPQSSGGNIYGDFKAYCRKFSIILLLFALSSLLNAIMSVSFFKYFDF